MTFQQSYLVIGGCGFLGRHVVEALLARGELQVAVFDLVQRHFDTNIQFFIGDITDEVAVSNAIQKTQATTIFHTASPVAGLAQQELYYKVNVEGTKTVLAAALAFGVKCFVYTSSAGLVFDGQDAIDVDERLPPPEKPIDAYNHTKGIAEKLVIEANGKEGMKTVAIRPSGIFGPGDRQTLIPLVNAVKKGQAKLQVGSNTNLVDWTYVGNVVKAHLIAAEKLSSSTAMTPREELLEYSIPSISRTTGERRIPTSRARPIGPAVIRPSNADELEAAFALPRSAEVRAFVRSRYDPLGAVALAREDEEPLQVAGRVFNITNGEPVYFWDTLRTLMLGVGAPPNDVNRRWVLPWSVGYVFAWAAEWVSWLKGTEPTFTQARVTYMCASRYYNIEKARRVLGYEPDVGMMEGIERTLEWWRSTQNVPQESKQ